ncbi:metalloregulator ArsR/SmtB family transcription factor [Rossellomorea sp. GCM10028870]|uniref:helix-turn-helix transcriptional regulator n=1 Tax=Rossellomorea sp. GCM10028870 TaxID=3273426 RepID=UPI002620B469|nr:helix-turn-helix domain-containing protein [uncultured Rossellomorea sp.]
MDMTLKVTSALSDPTRYSIYLFISERKQEVSVQDIAEEFHIHPNVARLHLAKLEEIRVLQSEYVKTGKGGRPGKRYISSEEVVQLSFPPRDFRLLSSLTIASLAKLGEEGFKALVETGYEYGKSLVNPYLQSHNLSLIELSQAEKLHILSEISTSIGFTLDESMTDADQIKFHYDHCPFNENAQLEPMFICGLHNALLKGMFETLYSVEEFKQEENMINDCSTCRYHVIVTN